MARKRNYAREYKARLARAAKKGYSKQVARGHAPKGKLGIKSAKRLGKKPGASIKRIKIRVTGREGAPIDLEREALIKQGIAIKDIAQIDFHDEASFIRKLLELGYTPREAYTLRFSP